MQEIFIPFIPIIEMIKPHLLKVIIASVAICMLVRAVRRSCKKHNARAHKAYNYKQPIYDPQAAAKDIVYRTSPRILAQRQLSYNAQVAQFHNGTIINFPVNAERLEIAVKTNYQFDHFDFKTGIIHALKKALKDPEALPITKKSLEIERQYLEDVKKLPPYITKEEKERIEGASTLSFEEYAEIERMLSKKQIERAAVEWTLDLTVIFALDYDPQNPDTPLRRSKTKKFTKKEILPIWDGCLKSVESNEYQRMLVTPSVRYHILRRDGFTCKICGRGAKDGAKIHVDHILPVSKGGTLGGANYENLRTLCDLCNVGKSDFYDPVGLN